MPPGAAKDADVAAEVVENAPAQNKPRPSPA
jgi:hypothetical protein